MPSSDLINSIQKIRFVNSYFGDSLFIYVVEGLDENGNMNDFYLREEDLEIVFTT